MELLQRRPAARILVAAGIVRYAPTMRSDDPPRSTPIDGRRRQAVIGAMAVIGLCLAALSAVAAEPVVFGVTPFASPREILTRYQPLREVVARTTGRPVELVSAPSFSVFLRRALAQTYDLALVSANHARALQTHAGYRPLLAEAGPFRALAIVARASGLAQPADLSGAVILGLDPTGLATLWGEWWLAENRVTAGTIRMVSGGDSIAELVASGGAQAGFISSATFDALPASMRERLAVLAQSRVFPGRVLLVNARLADQAEALSADLRRYADSPDGRIRLSQVGQSGLRPLLPGELDEMASFAEAALARIAPVPR